MLNKEKRRSEKKRDILNIFYFEKIKKEIEGKFAL